jgi:hypothetical protein
MFGEIPQQTGCLEPMHPGLQEDSPRHHFEAQLDTGQERDGWMDGWMDR